jgi:putative ATP-dependent endonuclease of OLD family
VVNGGGDSHAPKRARAFASLGYPTCLVVDGDASSNAAAIAAAVAAGVELVQWQAPNAIEEVIAAGLPQQGLQDVVDLAAAEIDGEAVRQHVAAALKVDRLAAVSVREWIAAHGEQSVRDAIGVAARSHDWFKREDRGERLATIVIRHRREARGTELATGLKSIKRFAYTDTTTATASPEAAAGDAGQ